MNAPFFQLGFFGDGTALLIALISGVLFGIILERSGMGNARNLVGQFMLTDLRVLKVLFTAIVTAAVGLVLLAGLGLVDPGRLYVHPTSLLPDLVGGLVLGAGFLISGYCPGTTVVAAATGRWDGWVCMVGLFVGMMAVGFATPYLGGFIEGHSLGSITLPQIIGIPAAWLTLPLAMVAIGAFLLAELAEVRWGGRKRSEQDLIGQRTLSDGRVVAVGLLVLALAALVVGQPQRVATTIISNQAFADGLARTPDCISPEDLAESIIAYKTPEILLDLRSQAEGGSTIPGAQHMNLEALICKAWHPDVKMVIFAEDQTITKVAWALLTSRGMTNVSIVSDGWKGWHDHVLFPTLPVNPPQEARDAVMRRIAVSQQFGGKPLFKEGSITPSSVPSDSKPASPSTSSQPAPKPLPRRILGGC